MGSAELHWYRTDQVDAVPTEPGLYAWYAVPTAGSRDWRVDIDSTTGLDRGGRNFGRFLATYTRRLRSPTIRVKAQGHLWSEWAGSLSESGSQMLADHLDALADKSSPSAGKELSWALTSAQTREVLAAVLTEASPRLSAPVYIGVAENLRQRLGKHIDTITKAHAELKASGALTPALRGAFGGRAAEAGLTLADLRVAVLPVPSLGRLGVPDQRRLSEAAEFVLNRWHHPLFGER